LKILNNSSWAIEELSKASFGDKRLDNRFLKVASAQALKPQSSINAANADWSSIKGAYRFFDNDKVTPEKILEPHFANTAHRIYGQEFIVVAQDTSFIDFSSHKMTLGLGTATAIGDYEVKGVHFHAGLALSHEGTPLGLVYSKLWSREKQTKKGHAHTKIPMRMKESYRWIECLEKTKELLPSGTNALVVGDRENDIYEYFERAIDLEIDVLVRLQHNRLIMDEFGDSERIEDFFLNEKVKGLIEVEIPGNGSRVARTATMEVKFGEVCLEGQPRGIKTARVNNRSDLILTVLRLTEKNPPSVKEALGWTLITTLPVHNLEDAEQVMKYYRMRWTIELYFKSLKSGCSVEKCRLEEAEKLLKFVALCGVVAWRLMWLTWLQREIPHASGGLVITEIEWKTLWLKKHREKIKAGLMEANPPEEIPDLRTITRWIANFGGFIGRKGYGNPGMITIWRGWQRIMDGAEIYEIIASK
jgi:hypothetical protein